MIKKKVWLAALASVGLSTAASATVVTLGDWSQDVASFGGAVSDTVSAPSPFFGERTLTAVRTSNVGFVTCDVDDGTLKADLWLLARGYCFSSHEVLADFTLESIDFGASLASLIGGPAAVSFYKNGLAIGQQAISAGYHDYSLSFSNISFTAGDTFWYAPIGGRSSHIKMSPLQVDINAVPEPGSLALASLGLLGLGVLRRRSVA